MNCTLPSLLDSILNSASYWNLEDSVPGAQLTATVLVTVTSHEGGTGHNFARKGNPRSTICNRRPCTLILGWDRTKGSWYG